MKKGLTGLILIFLLNTLFYANPAKAVKEYTLENGMQVFLLEDFSDALVHVDFQVRAGFSDQRPDNMGFFTLYSNLIKAKTNNLDFSLVECNSDSTSYKFTTTNSDLEDSIENLAVAIFDSQFSDDLIKEELDLLKKRVEEDSKSPAYLINSAIDSKIFSSSPWKHDSGIYPSLFKYLTVSQARTYLDDIKYNFYQPQKAAIFVSGNINCESLYNIINNYFGKYYSSVKTTKEKLLPENQSGRKFVIYDDEFSKDLTQVVIQYTLLDMEKADILSAALNNNYSTFKENALSIEELNIPGNEYINVAQAHKEDKARLIFQTLLQKPENKEISSNSLKQSLLFLDQVLNVKNYLQESEFESGKENLLYNQEKICQSSSIFMQNLSDFWIMQAHTNYFWPQDKIEDYPNSLTVAKMMARSNYLKSISCQDCIKSLESEEPFLFVIINTKDFKENKKEYLEAGFQALNSKNSSWYLQAMYKNIKDQLKPDSYQLSYNSRNSMDNEFYKKNIDSIKNYQLENGIKIVTKNNPNSQGLSILLNVKGGKMLSSQDNGFEEVMVNLLSLLIQREIYNYQAQGIILGNPSISSQTDLFTSHILIDCDYMDFSAIIRAMSKALIYGQIPPASADRAVANRQYKKRLENGSAVTQLMAYGIKNIYPNSDFTKIFDAQNEVLQNTTYTDILSAYPRLLNANKYDFIICGNYQKEEEIINIISQNFSKLEKKEKFTFTLPEGKFPKKSSKVSIIHTFLTDIPAEEAGPQPAILIPTTEFLDPAIFYFKAPEDSNQLYLFNALINYLEKILSQEINKNPRLSETKVLLQLTQPKMNFASLIFTNVSHTKELDSCWKIAIKRLRQELENRPIEISQEIKNYWNLKELEASGSNSGTALLLQKGFEYKIDEPKADYYLQEYKSIQKANAQDFYSILDYFPITPDYRLYSKDSKN
ncbi:MAG: insulinase family protein [Treponema sp.]|nr:insulinase family protein [Treponema sp.]